MRLAGTREVAQLLGVSTSRVYELRVSGRLPATVADLACGPIWDLGEVEAFLAGWDRRPGRPRLDRACGR